MTLSEAAVSRLLLANDEAIVRRCRKVLARSWDTFEQDQGADPFGAHSRVELHIDRANLLTGRWAMFVYWSSENEGWSGMHLLIEGAFVWPLSCVEVF